MKAKHIIVILVLAAIGITSCQQVEPVHQPESVSELMDTILNRGFTITHNIYCKYDSTYEDVYRFGRNIYYKCNKKERDLKLYLPDITPKLLDSICMKSEESYRYCTSDSLDYNIIISKDPYESVTYTQNKSWCWVNNMSYEGFYLAHTITKKANDSSNDYDPAPIHETLQKFLSEQKKVQKYDICYEWDKGVPVSNFYCRYQIMGSGPNSLGASKVTGTLYVVSLKGEDMRDSLHTELTKRIEKLLTKRPIYGAHFNSNASSPQEPYMMQDVFVHDYRKKPSFNYSVMIDHFNKDLHILELDYNDSPRAAIPSLWNSITHNHNAEVTYRIPE